MEITATKKIQMDKQGIQVANFPLFMIIGRKREMIVIRFIE